MKIVIRRTPWGLLACAALALLAGCEFPRDPDRTLERVRGGTMRVGVVENPPWVQRSGSSDEPTGVEADLVRGFAQRVNARIEWVWGTENDHMKALENSSLDLVAAGLTDQSPWDGQVGLTRPYFTERVVVGVPPNSPVPRGLARQRVAVQSGSALVHLLEKKHAVPSPVADMAERNAPPPGLPVAAPLWQIEKWRLVPTDTELEQEKHVLAVPPGENAWLMAWENYLQTQGPQVQARLKGSTDR